MMQFVNELTRVAAPGGRIIIVTWCHRDLDEGENSLKPDELVSVRTLTLLPACASCPHFHAPFLFFSFFEVT